ncbi:MAG: ABC transporter permease [Alphaproteobacteria bacterium]|nr:ABC transporter permease [Alphaproteobacteria bacterium]
MDFAFLYSSFLRLIAGIPLTLQLAFSSIGLGFCLAVLLAAMMRSRLLPLAWIAEGFVFVFRGTPLLVQIFLIYYGLGQFRPYLDEMGIWWFFRSPYYCALLALTLNTAAYGAEIVRGGLQSVPHGQIEAARAFGMSGFTLYRRIVAPIALRQALPAYGNEIILMIKATSLVSTITLMEVTGLAHKIISETFRAFEVFFVAGAIYLAINFAMARLIALAEDRIAPDLGRAAATIEMGKLSH